MSRTPFSNVNNIHVHSMIPWSPCLICPYLIWHFNTMFIQAVTSLMSLWIFIKTGLRINWLPSLINSHVCLNYFANDRIIAWVAWINHFPPGTTFLSKLNNNYYLRLFLSHVVMIMSADLPFKRMSGDICCWSSRLVSMCTDIIIEFKKLAP